jgi:hypothetical protein
LLLSIDLACHQLLPAGECSLPKLPGLPLLVGYVYTSLIEMGLSRGHRRYLMYGGLQLVSFVIIEFEIKMNLFYSITPMSLYRRTTMYNRKDVNSN